MRLSFIGKKLGGEIKAPPSKSIYHRELIVRFLCGDRDNLRPAKGDNEDVQATKACLRAIYEASEAESEEVILPCNESGSTLRFMIPVASAFLLGQQRGDGGESGDGGEGCIRGRRLVFTTAGRLCDRPISELAEAMAPHGIEIKRNTEDRTITVTGCMTSGVYKIDGSVSSQYISGLIMALPLFDDESRIEVTGALKSVHYIELTVQALNKYGCGVGRDGNSFIPAAGGYARKPDCDISVEGDWSNGAFLLCLREFTDIEVTNLNPDSAQGDKAILDFLELIHEAEKDENVAEVRFDCTDVPDIAPYMAVLGAFKAKKTVLTGTARLRIKESDRSRAVCEQLAAVGVKTIEDEDSITIFAYNGETNEEPPYVVLKSYHDHRMAMCAVLIAAALETAVEIDEIDCMNKSFPELRELCIKELSE